MPPGGAACHCATAGTLQGGCDRKTGVCVCRLGVSGPNCDMCSRGHCDSFPTCETCPLCYFDQEGRIGDLSLSLKELAGRGPSPPAGPGQPANQERRIKALEAQLKRIRASVPRTPSSSPQMNKAFAELNRLRYTPRREDGFLGSPPTW